MNTNLSRADKATIRAHVLAYYADRDARDVRIHADGSVTAYVDAMLNTNQSGRMFCGWDCNLLREARLK